MMIFWPLHLGWAILVVVFSIPLIAYRSWRRKRDAVLPTPKMRRRNRQPRR
jgi:hypothetical protein